MSYELYEIEKSQYKPYISRTRYKEIEISKITAEIAGKVGALYWNLITLGKANVYMIRDEAGKRIHSSYVIPKCYKFPFLRGGGYHDIEIGPCVTDANYRGQGIYPYVLSEIIRNELGEKDKAFMIVDDGNHASIRGVLKAGFVKTSKIKKDRRKRYVVVNEIDTEYEVQ